MEIIVKVGGRIVDVIESFAESVLVQDPASKEIFSVSYNDLDLNDGSLYNKIEMTNNVISLRWWKSCRAKRKSKQSNQAQKYKLLNPLSPVKP